MDYKRYIDVLTTCFQEVFEDMASTEVERVTVKDDERNNPEYVLEQVIAYEHLEDDLKGAFALGFPSESMAVTVASAISESIGLGEVAEYSKDARETLGEFMNTVVGRTLTKWDAMGLPTRFDPPRTMDPEEMKAFHGAHTLEYIIVLTLKVGHIQFHVSFTRSGDDPLHGKSVLVTDDSKLIRRLLTNALEEVGLEVHTATNGREAISAYQEKSPDIVLMDIVMPDMTGLEATRAILEIDDAAKVLMLTSTSSREEITTAQDIGAINYLLKPVKIPLLVEALRRALA